MSQVSVFDMSGKLLEEKPISNAFLEKDIKYQAIKLAVVGYLAHQRQGNAATKTRGMISSSGKKPWKQKGTGRARVGSRSSPVWRGGGTVFGPKPHDFVFKVTKQTKKLAKDSALRIRLKDGNVMLLRDLILEESKTKLMANVFENLHLENQTVLLITQGVNRKIYLACRNLEKVRVINADDLNAYEILRAKKLVFDENAFDSLKIGSGEN